MLRLEMILQLCHLQDVETIIGNLPKKKTFTVISLFESGLADFDNNIAFINLDTLDEFFNLNKEKEI